MEREQPPEQRQGLAAGVAGAVDMKTRHGQHPRRQQGHPPRGELSRIGVEDGHAAHAEKRLDQVAHPWREPPRNHRQRAQIAHQGFGQNGLVPGEARVGLRKVLRQQKLGAPAQFLPGPREQAANNAQFLVFRARIHQRLRVVRAVDAGGLHVVETQKYGGGKNRGENQSASAHG